MKKIFSSFLVFAVSVLVAGAQSYTISPEDYCTRQVHLDFHTSGLIGDIGKNFNKQEWQASLKEARVNSINIFAKGHHGYSYYPTQVGTVHPYLDFDLMGAQIEACHEIGVKCPIYFTVGWSLLDAVRHPEWMVLDKQGHQSSWRRTKDLKEDDPFPNTTWDLLMPAGDYLDLILAQTEEICKNYDVDGFWYDIIPISQIDWSPRARKAMAEAGVDIQNAEAVENFHIAQIRRFMEGCNEIIKKYHPEASIFYNWTTALNQRLTFKHQLYKYDTAFDLEDLPTTWDGYNVFPMRAKFFANENRPVTGMSGKFHTAWGEFGGVKYVNALKYEAAAMIANGANVNFGDQLHPMGGLDTETYKRIGEAYRYVEQIEEYGAGGKHVSDLGLWMAFDNRAEQAASLLLLDCHANYVVANNLEDWSGLETIVVPSKDCISGKDRKRFDDFIARGGKVVVMGKGAFCPGTHDFAFDIDAEYLGEAQYDIDYTVVREAVAQNVAATPFLNYVPAYRVAPGKSVEVMADLCEPYFSRTVKHYSSHRNTPNRLENAAHPAVFRSGNVYVAAHPLDLMYKDDGAQIHRELFHNILSAAYTDPMIEVKNLPSCGRINLLQFPDKNRYVAHLLYAAPIQRGSAQVIEDLPTINDVEVILDVDQKVKKAYLVPGKHPLKLNRKAGKYAVTVPSFSCHTAVVFEY